VRIAFVTYDYYPTPGGVETRAYYLASELAKTHEVTVYTRNAACRDKASFNHEVVEFSYSRRQGTRGLDFLRKIWPEIKGERFDVICLEQLGIHNLLALSKAAKLFVITIHGLDVANASPLLKPIYARIVRRRNVRTVSVSEYLRKAFIRDYRVPQTLVHVIEHGVDTKLFRPLKPKRKGLFLFVGRFTPEKDPCACVEAVRILRDSYGIDSIKLKMIGSGPLLDNVRRMVVLHRLDSNVELLGEIRNRELPPYYSEAIATICPRLAGARVGHVLLESMACGTPVIVGDFGDTAGSYVSDCGFLVPLHDPVAIARRIQEILVSPGEAQEKAASARREAERHDYSIVASKLCSLYDEWLHSSVLPLSPDM